MELGRWPLLQAQSIADVQEALDGAVSVLDAAAGNASTPGGYHPRTRVQQLYAASVAPFVSEHPEYAYLPAAYSGYSCTPHRKDAGAVTLHTAHTGAVSHCFFAPVGPHEGLAQADYLLTERYQKEFAAVEQKDKLLAELYAAGIEGQCIIPLAGSAYAYRAGLWPSLWEARPDAPLPLYANVLEAALAIERGWVADAPSFLALASRHAWYDTFDVELEADRALLVEHLGQRAGGSRDLDLLLQRVGIRPQMPVKVPAVGASDLWGYVKERMTWIWLLGDPVVKRLAVQGLKRYVLAAPRDNGAAPDSRADAERRLQAGQELCYYFFALHQVFTAPVFYARGGAMNASPQDTQIWFTSLLPGSFLEAAQDELDDVFARFFLQVNAITRRLKLTGQVTLEQADVLELIPRETLPHVALAEMPAAMRMLADVPRLVDSPHRSDPERQPAVQRRIAQLYSAKLGDTVAQAGRTLARKLFTTAITPAWLDWAALASPDVRVQAGLRKVKLGLDVREFHESLAGAREIAGASEPTLFSHRTPPTKFYVWQQGNAADTIAFAETRDGALLTGTDL